jgi:hypothetical protein
MSAASTGKSPSIFGVFFFATLMALLGAVLGFAYMASFEAQAFSSQEDYQDSLADMEEPVPAVKPGDAYYIEGTIASNRSWEAKRQQLAAGKAGSVRLAETELNAWMSAKFRAGTSSTDVDQAGLLIVPAVPSFALLGEGRFFFNLPLTITAYGSTSDFTLSARCHLDPSSKISFDEVSVCSAKVPLPNIIGVQLIGILMQSYEDTEEYQILADAFAHADTVAVEGHELVFNLP